MPWMAAYEIAWRDAHPDIGYRLRVYNRSRGWYYIAKQRALLNSKPTLYRQKQIEAMTVVLLERQATVLAAPSLATPVLAKEE